MITRVIDARGNVLHDCAREGCDNSWDGFAIKSGFKVQTGLAADGVTPIIATLAKGDSIPNRTDPDPSLWTVAGNTAKLKPNVGP